MARLFLKPPTRSAWLRLRCRGVGCAPARHVMACLVVAWSVMVSYANHSRLGTEADQRGRGGMNHGMSSQGAACFVPLRPGGSRLLTKLVQARCRINAGGLGWTLVRCGWIRFVVACHVCARLVAACCGLACNRHRGRRGEASTPRGGMHRGMVRRVDVGSGKSLPG